jgi:hypothetical protein
MDAKKDWKSRHAGIAIGLFTGMHWLEVFEQELPQSLTLFDRPNKSAPW